MNCLANYYAIIRLGHLWAKAAGASWSFTHCKPNYIVKVSNLIPVIPYPLGTAEPSPQDVMVVEYLLNRTLCFLFSHVVLLRTWRLSRLVKLNQQENNYKICKTR